MLGTEGSHGQHPVFVPAELPTSTHVFVRREPMKEGLKPLYQGPYCVIRRTEKHFTVYLDGEEKMLSIDQLKPAFLPVKPTVETIYLLTSKSVSNVKISKHVHFV